MNEANDFYEDMRSKHQNVLDWRDGSQGDAKSSTNNSSGAKDGTAPSASQSDSVSGNGDANEEGTTASTKGGMPSPAKDAVDLTPNG